MPVGGPDRSDHRPFVSHRVNERLRRGVPGPDGFRRHWVIDNTSLDPWGRLHRTSDEADSAGLARVVRVDRGECDVVTAAGVVRVLSDSQRAQDEIAPVTGDWVRVADEDGLGPVIVEVFPRRTSVSRRDPAEKDAEQVLAANADVVGVVHGLDRPLPPGRLERLMVVAHRSGAQPLVVLTKADAPDDPEIEATVRSVAGPTPVITTSIVDATGLDDLRAAVPPATTLALIGASGVGKSSLVNALVGSELLDVGEVRESDAKGRHTTTARELVRLPDDAGLLLDTPGIRAVGLWEAEDALELVFGDLEELAGQCRFGDCAHGAEPGCAIVAAVDEGRMDERRVDRYRALAEELQTQRDREEQRERRDRKEGGRRRRRR